MPAKRIPLCEHRHRQDCEAVGPRKSEVKAAVRIVNAEAYLPWVIFFTYSFFAGFYFDGGGRFLCEWGCCDASVRRSAALISLQGRPSGEHI